jgi:hypothetical protein
MGMKEMAPIGVETGEKASNFTSFGEGYIVIGDRGYCSKQGIEYLLERGCDFIFRFGTKRIDVYNARGNKVGVGVFQGVKAGGKRRKRRRRGLRP